jgi:hypothetical protein
VRAKCEILQDYAAPTARIGLPKHGDSAADEPLGR